MDSKNVLNAGFMYNKFFYVFIIVLVVIFVVHMPVMLSGRNTSLESVAEAETLKEFNRLNMRNVGVVQSNCLVDKNICLVIVRHGVFEYIVTNRCSDKQCIVMELYRKL